MVAAQRLTVLKRMVAAQRLTVLKKTSVVLKLSETTIPRYRYPVCASRHDRSFCSRFANYTISVVGILVFLPLFASLAGVVATVVFGQVYPRVS